MISVVIWFHTTGLLSCPMWTFSRLRVDTSQLGSVLSSCWDFRQIT